MTEIETLIADHRAAIDEFIAAARTYDAATWTTPRAPGAWSPAQIAEHLAVVYEYNRKVATGTAPDPIPRLFRPLVQPFARRIVVDNTLKAGRFTRKGRAPEFFRPSAVPPASSVVLARLDAAVRGLESDLRSRHPEARHTIAHPIFGTIPTTSWIRLQAIHARHHRAQLPG
jgi:DinB superfamily